MIIVSGGAKVTTKHRVVIETVFQQEVLFQEIFNIKNSSLTEQVFFSKYNILKTRNLSIEKASNSKTTMMIISLTYRHNPDKRYENPDNGGAS